MLNYSASRMGKIHFLSDITSVYRELNSSASHIKGFKNRYKFSVSAQGLRAYLCRRDNLSTDLSALIERRYANVLLHHLVLNPDYKPVVPLLPNTHRFELFLQRHKLLGIYLAIKAITTPINILRKQSHWIPIPKAAATPPKPTIADAEINVAP